jgi:hypothetical protein
MSSSSSRRIALALVLAVLALPAVALAGDRHQQRATRPAVEHQVAGPVEVLAALWQRLVAAWGAVGAEIDPDGATTPAPVGPEIDPDGASSAPGDVGAEIDPDG